MRRIRLGYIVMVLLVIFASCSKDKQVLLENTWLVEYTKENADSELVYPYFDFSILSFIEKDKYVFQSETYCIIGRVNVESGNKISFEWTGTSPESRFARSFIISLVGVNQYEIDGDKLVLKGDNGEEIRFVKKIFKK